MQEAYVKSILPNVVCKLLNLTFGPSFNPSKELSLMTLIEIFDGLLEFNLSCSERMNLHEFLKVEKGLRDGELVRTSGGSQEGFEFVPCW